MFKKLTYVLMLILLGMGAAFGQTGGVSGNWTWNGYNIDALVTIDQNLLYYKATASTGTVNVTINSTNYTTYETAIAAVYDQLVEHATPMPTSWTSNVAGTTVYKVSGTVTMASARTISGTLVLVGDGTVQSNYASYNISLSGNLILQGNVVLDGTERNRSNAFISGGGKLYMADNATIQKCINTNASSYGGAVSLSGSNATLYMAGGVIGDNSTTDLTWTKVSGTKRVYKLGTTKGNSAYEGAGVCIYLGKAYLNGGKIRGNYVQYNNNGNSWGGGMRTQNATILISGTTEISFNLANVGGGLCATEGSVEISGGTFYNNRVAVTDDITPGKNVGGAIEFMGCRMNIHGGTYSYNYSVNTGGAFHMSDISAISGTGNVIKDVTVDHNYCYMNGIIDMQETNIRIASGYYHDNTGGSAGVIFHLSNPVNYDGDYTLTIGDAKNGGTPIFENNHSLGYNLNDVNVSGYGGPTSPTLNSNGCAGAITLVDVSLDIEQATFTGNTAVNNGGAIFVYNDNTTYPGKCRLYGGTFTSNKAGVENMTPTGGESDDEGMGGAIYVKGRNATLQIGGNPTGVTVADPIFKSNNSRLDGGAMYVDGGSVTMYGGTFGGSNEGDGNSSTNGNGGGIYVNVDNNNKTALQVNSGTFSGNKALNGNGGGFYVAKGKVELTERTGQTPADVITINNVNEAKNGGGFFVNGGTITITGAEISGNKATANGNNTGNGGGVYSNGGVLTINNGDILSNDAVNGGGGYVNGGTLEINGGNIDNNSATNGGGFYVNGGVLNLSGGTIGTPDGNQATQDGGGFYVIGGTANITNGIVECNYAQRHGGGLFMIGAAGNRSTANFSNGTFQYNHAANGGGGIYIDSYADLKMSGTSVIKYNYVPEGQKGGGVFKTGAIVNNASTSMLWVSGSALQIVNNYIGEVATPNGSGEIEDRTRNNAYLNSYWDYITVDDAVGGGLTDNVKIGISVNVTSTDDLPTPVIHSENEDNANAVFYILKEQSDEDNGVFDDAQKYVAVYQSNPDPFNLKEIFFIATWIANVEEPDDFDADSIATPEELAWFMVLANGLKGQTADPDINGTVVADIDMSGFYWTPIGEWDHNDNQASHSVYIGNFNGQGHTITGLNTCGIIGYFNYGLFGHTGADANISNVVLADCNFQSGETARMGNLIAEMDGGVAENCIVSGTLNPAGSETIGDDVHYCVVGGLIGETKGAATIRNCIATEEIDATYQEGTEFTRAQAYTAGGLVGMTSANTIIENCFANPEIHHSGMQIDGQAASTVSRYVGGLVGENYGTVKNCYVRLERANTLDHVKSKFGMFAGLNNGTIDSCYYPESSLRNIKVGSTSTPNQPLINAGSQPTPAHYGQYNAVIRPYTYTSYLKDNQVMMNGESAYGTTEATTLLSKLNTWATANGSNYSHWMRTEGSDVNDDYPVLSYDNLISTLNYTTVGSKDGIRLEYDNRFNEIYGRFAAETEKEGCLFVYRTPWTGTIASPADEVIGNGVTVNNSGTDIKVFVEDGVALLQDAGSTLVNTYTCHEFNDASRSWHHISSSLNNDSPIGFSYTQNAAYNEELNPCGASIATGNYASFLPAGIPMADLDLYCFYETEYHWINFKRNSSSHWHMNDKHQYIDYDNEDNLVAGKGYLASFAGRTFVQAGGELANGNVTISVTAEAGSLNSSAQPTAIPADEGTELKGYNLLGNPYQSYLDIAAFMKENSSLLVNTVKSGIDVPSYAIYDSEANAYVQGMASKPSLGSRAASDQIKMHEGFFIYTANDGDATFTNDMRRTEYTPTGTKRAEQPAYPLVNLVVTDESGESDIAVAEFGRTQTEGAAKMKQIGADGKIYFHYADDDYALLYLNEDTDRLPVHFDAIENGTYTMTWSTANATFSYLHLVDNMTGIDVDMLSSDAYTFTASSSDYKSRFKLMFAYTGVEENEAASTSSASFAFMHDGALTVNGEGMLEVIDMSGRTIVSSRLTDAQNTVSLPQAAQGVYVLRLTNDNQSKVQKIVIE